MSLPHSATPRPFPALAGDVLLGSDGPPTPDSLSAGTVAGFRHPVPTEHLRDLVTVHTAEGACTYASPSSLALLGVPPEEMLGMPLSHFLHPDDCIQARRALRGHLSDRQESVLVHRLRRQDGNYFWAESTNRTRPHPSDQTQFEIVSATRDITRRKLAEEELVATHALLDSVYEAVPIGLCLLDEAGQVIQCNGAFARLVESPPSVIAGRAVTELLDAVDLARAREAAGAIREGELRTSTGEVVPVELSLTALTTRTVTHHLLTTTDLRARKRMEARLREARQLESLGTLAGGIAHDFNNLLAIILGYASLLRDAGSDPERLGHYANTIIDAGRRGADVVRQLQLFASQQDAELTRTDVHALLDEVVLRLGSNWPDTIGVQRDFSAHDSAVTVDSQQLSHGLQQLFQNAVEAMPDGGTLTIRTGEVIRSTPAVGGGAGELTHYLRISIEDSGRGMDAATRARMFEPFFAKDKGPAVRGLGLAVVYGIMRAHRGMIEVDSAPGCGTRVHLLLPRAPAPSPVATGAPADSAAPARPSTVAARTVLIVEDEHDIGALWQELLPTENLAVLWARDAEEALRLFRVHRDSIGVVFTDIGLPGMDGWQLAQRIRAEAPGVPLALASGAFSASEPARHNLAEPIILLAKPYDAFKIIGSLKRLLAL